MGGVLGRLRDSQALHRPPAKLDTALAADRLFHTCCLMLQTSAKVSNLVLEP